jgi:hypothetical protein
VIRVDWTAGYRAVPGTHIRIDGVYPAGVFTLRVYVPDQGMDVTGGVGLPQVTWQPNSEAARAC